MLDKIFNKKMDKPINKKMDRPTPSAKRLGEVYSIQERMNRIYEINKRNVQDNLDKGLVSFFVNTLLTTSLFENSLRGLPENATSDDVNDATRRFDAEELSKAESLARDIVAKAFLNWLESQKDVFTHNFDINSPWSTFKVTVKNKDSTTLKNIEAIKAWKPKE